MKGSDLTSGDADESTTEQPRAVACALQKGGVGKTTIAINLADRLADRGHDVLLVDVDQQGNATDGLGLGDAYTSEQHIGHALRGDADPQSLIRDSGHGFDVLPAHEDLDEVEEYIKNTTMGHTVIADEVVDPLLGDEYDYIVVDCPPNLGALSDAALFSTRHVVTPIQMSQASVGGFRRMMEQQINPLSRATDVSLLALVPNRLKGDSEEKRILGQIEDSPFVDQLPGFARSTEFENSPGPGIRERVAFRRAYRDGVPLSKHDPESDMLPRLDELARIVEDGGIR